MTSAPTERIHHYQTRSAESAREMEVLFESEYFQGAADRAYYAVFHLTQALLASEGLEYNSHEAVIAAFGREFAKTKRIDPKYHKILRQAFDLRLTADYDVEVSIDQETAQDLISSCRDFLQTIGAYLGRTNP